MERKHPYVSTDGNGTWYPQACRFLRLSHHHLHSPFEKSVIERTVQYIKDRTEYLMITFHAGLRIVN
jgi:putative transposase